MCCVCAAAHESDPGPEFFNKWMDRRSAHPRFPLDAVARVIVTYDMWTGMRTNGWHARWQPNWRRGAAVPATIGIGQFVRIRICLPDDAVEE